MDPMAKAVDLLVMVLAACAAYAVLAGCTAALMERKDDQEDKPGAEAPESLPAGGPDPATHDEPAGTAAHPGTDLRTPMAERTRLRATARATLRADGPRVGAQPRGAGGPGGGADGGGGAVVGVERSAAGGAGAGAGAAAVGRKPGVRGGERGPDG